MSDLPNSVDAFLNHQRSAGRDGGGKYLSKWKKNKPPTVDVWLHTALIPKAVWQHKFPRVVVREDKDTGASSRAIWGGNYTCYEDETVLRAQYRRDRESGARKIPPRACPMCRMIETFWEMVDEGRIAWTDPVFRFEGDERVDVLHAAGLYNGFQADNFNDRQRASFRESKLSSRDVWRENATAKCNYLFAVVDNAHVEEGVQIAVETNLLGDKVKAVINDQIKADGREFGNPFVTPYAIQWEFDPTDGITFDKKYSARKMGRIPMTPAIEDLIRGPLPDISGVVKPFNAETMRAYLERHCLVKDFPWDHVFNVVEAQPEAPPPPAVSHSRTVNVDTRIEAVRPEVPLDPDACELCGKTEAQGCPHVACDACEKPMLLTDAKCAHCGKVYREEPKAPVAKAVAPKAHETGDKVGF